MIKLPKSGAVLDKELLITDFCDGRQWSRNLGWVETFHPCRYCLRNRHNEEPPTVLPACRRAQYTPCIKEYEELWKETFLGKGAQFRLDNYGLEDGTGRPKGYFMGEHDGVMDRHGLRLLPGPSGADRYLQQRRRLLQGADLDEAVRLPYLPSVCPQVPRTA